MLLVLAAQVGLGTALAAVLAGVYGFVAGYSAMLGCLIAAVPNAFLALRLALPRRDPGAKALLRAAYIGELGKLALTVLFFSLVFATVRPLAAVPLFAGFIVTTLVPLLVGFVGDKQEKEQEAVNLNGD
ncbi:MAG: ATP synthase subunit I [Woeseiaceae bacterium]|nr:ATP synthase subunit I [Woeseiaceae bacterium]